MYKREREREIKITITIAMHVDEECGSDAYWLEHPPQWVNRFAIGMVSNPKVVSKSKGLTMGGFTRILTGAVARLATDNGCGVLPTCRQWLCLTPATLCRGVPSQPK